MGIKMIIGDCGSGKSLQAVLIAVKYMKKGFPVFSNLYLKGAYKIQLEDLLKYELPPSSIVIIDEGASYGLGSRGGMYKTTCKENIVEFFTMYRHYRVAEIVVVSPSFNDVLPVIRDNANEIIVVKRSILNILKFNKTRRISRAITISTEGEPKMAYNWVFLSTRFHNRRPAFKNYDSWVSKKLEQKQWEVW